MYIESLNGASNDIINYVSNNKNLDRITDVIASYLPFNINKKLEYMQNINPLKRAKALIKDMLEECKKQGIDRLFLEVRASNSPAISLYEKFSFRQFSVRKKYYDGEEDALLYAVLL